MFMKPSQRVKNIIVIADEKNRKTIWIQCKNRR